MKISIDNAIEKPSEKNYLKQEFDDYLRCFESLAMNNLATDLTPKWHPDIEFKDPFNHVFNAKHCERIFQHMFKQCYEPTFKVINSYFDKDQGSVYWQFHFRLSENAERVETIIGNSLIQLDDQGLVTCHIDFWNAGEYVYERIPLLGNLIRLIKRKLSVA